MVPHTLLLSKVCGFYLGGNILKETPETLKRKIENINRKIVKVMAQNRCYRTDGKYQELIAERSRLIIELGRLIRKVEYIKELEYKNRGVRL